MPAGSVMDVIAWSLFVPACFALNMAPGPNNMLAFSNAARFGLAPALLASGGRLIAFAIMIAFVAVGLGALLAASETGFLVVKWLGAAYLVYVGVKLLRSRIDAAAVADKPDASLRELARHEFLLAAGNPKAIAVFTAFFPQFIDPASASAMQFMAMGAVFLVLECVAIAIFAAAGRLARGALRHGRIFGWLNKGVGAFLVASGVSLAFSNR
jgi:threonine/homoserine/homoserine lactone efflux protein